MSILGPRMTDIFDRIERMERELNLRQLQVNRLLNITQAINNNVSAPDLFRMYQAFLSYELQVERMALFVRREEADLNASDWYCSSNLGLTDAQIRTDLNEELRNYKRMVNTDGSSHPFISMFELVIPVLHKERPIAYVFIGGFGERDDKYERVQFITTITNIIAVAIENKRLFKRQLEQERLERELELGAEVQRLLIPKSLPTKDQYELSSLYRPQLGVGGDYYDYAEFDDGKLYFCIGDFSGKGVSAALLMANLQANFHILIRKREGLEAFVRELNDSVLRITGGERFVTFFIAEYDIHTGELVYVNAGHNPPVLVNDERVSLLEKGCTILGMFADLPEFELGRVQLHDQALLVTYTDGLTDLQNPAGEYFDEDLLREFTAGHAGRSANQFNRALQEKLELFRSGGQFPDDFTVVTCKIFGGAEAG